MAKVICAPLLKMECRRSIPVGLAASQCGSDDLPMEMKSGSGAVAQIDLFRPESLAQKQVELLTFEMEAALKRADAAEKQLADLREQLRDDQKTARERGYQEGFDQAQEQVIAEHKNESEAIGKLLQSLLREQERLVQLTEDAVVEIAFAAVVKILGQTSADTSLVTAMVRQAMRNVTDQEGLVVHVSLHDFQLLEKHTSDEEGGEWSEIEFRADERVELGGCIIESRLGSLDARLELQIVELKRLLTEARVQN